MTDAYDISRHPDLIRLLAKTDFVPSYLALCAKYSAGVGIDAVGPYRIASPGPGGLIFGYATAGEQAIAEGVDILARVISQF